VRSVTIYGNIYKLRRVAELLAPATDFTWLREIEQELEWDMQPASKLDRIVDSDRIVKAGLDLMRDAETNDTISSFRRSLQHRNGLMIAFLAFLPLRLKNFASLKIGTSLIQVDEHWNVVIPARDTKSGRAEERRVPNFLQPFLNRYVDIYRSTAGPENKALWISGTGQKLGYSGCERVITETTRTALGVPISPHLFRACAASMAYLYAGDQPHLAAGILQHTNPRNRGPLQQGKRSEFRQGVCRTCRASIKRSLVLAVANTNPRRRVAAPSESAFPPIATEQRTLSKVRYVPKAAIGRLSDHVLSFGLPSSSAVISLKMLQDVPPSE
jgi:hypothetical protein